MVTVGTVRFTVPPKLSRLVMVIVELPAAPPKTVAGETALALMLKSPTWTVIVTGWPAVPKPVAVLAVRVAL